MRPHFAGPPRLSPTLHSHASRSPRPHWVYRSARRISADMGYRACVLKSSVPSLISTYCVLHTVADDLGSPETLHFPRAKYPHQLCHARARRLCGYRCYGNDRLPDH